MLICLVYISFDVVSVQICPLVKEGLFLLLNSESYFYNLDTSALSLTIYYCGQESLRRNGVAIMVNNRVRNAVLGCNLKNNRIISVHFQGKLCNITVSKSMTGPVTLKKLKLNSSMKTYKTFQN